jgi:drug/metabolite transporter (DMT)-like permease
MTMVLVILGSIACAVGGQLSLKRGMNRTGRISRSNRQLDWRGGAPQILAGLCFYGTSTVLWLYALSRVELSYAFPFLSLSYVAIMFGARFGLAESLPGHRLVGSAFIVLGVVLVGLSRS